MKTPYVKPQSEIVWLHAPTLLVNTSGVTQGAPGTWESLNPFSNSFADPFNVRQGIDDLML